MKSLMIFLMTQNISTFKRFSKTINEVRKNLEQLKSRTAAMKERLLWTMRYLKGKTGKQLDTQ